MINAHRCAIITTSKQQTTSARGKKMKTVTRYEIREYKTSTSYSTSLSSKLRERKAATKLIKRLKKMGHDAFASPMKVAA